MIKSVGGVAVKSKHRLSCHCGTVVLELDLPDGIVNPRRCDCSICRRKGAIVASVVLSGITVIQGEDALKLYQFNTEVASSSFQQYSYLSGNPEVELVPTEDDG